MELTVVLEVGMILVVLFSPNFFLITRKVQNKLQERKKILHLPTHKDLNSVFLC